MNCLNLLRYSFHLHTTVSQWDEYRNNKHEHVVLREPLEWVDGKFYQPLLISRTTRIPWMH